MANTLFYLMAVVAVIAALWVVMAKNPVKCVLALLACFFALAVIYLLAGFQFLAAVQILVYAGAIMVLFLFVIMLLNLGAPGGADRIDAGLLGRRPWLLASAIGAALLLTTVLAAQRSLLPAIPDGASATGIDSVEGLAGEMFGRYILPFEAISLLLLATAVAVLVLAKRERHAGARGER